MYKIVLIVFLFVLFGCDSESLTKPDVLLNKNEEVSFWIDTNVSPGSYVDAQGVWHVEYSGLHYFTIKGSIPQLNPLYVINRVPLIEVAFDSDFFYIPGIVTWRYAVYSYRGDFADRLLTTPIPVGYQTFTFPQLIKQYSIMNLAGYEITKNPNVDVNHPAYSTYFASYSKYNYNPQQQMVFFPDFVGEKVTVFIRASLGEGENVISKELKIIFEDKI
jgi:hypothetical protein